MFDPLAACAKAEIARMSSEISCSSFFPPQPPILLDWLGKDDPRLEADLNPPSKGKTASSLRAKDKTYSFPQFPACSASAGAFLINLVNPPIQEEKGARENR